MKLTVPYPPARGGRVVLWSYLASMPFGGMTWQVLHHLVGLGRLGYDVRYAEDSESPGLSPLTYEPTDDYTANARFLAHHMELVGAVAAGEIDLATLVAGWPDETVVQCMSAYRESRWPAGAPPDFAFSFVTAKRYVHFRSLGDMSDRKPVRSPRFEQLQAIGERLGVL
jgi:hypothetical protein